MSDKKTITVRIAVCVDFRGKYNAVGWDISDEGFDEESVMDTCLEGGPDGIPVAVHWITAEVPIPQVAEIAGTVGPAEVDG